MTTARLLSLINTTSETLSPTAVMQEQPLISGEQLYFYLILYVAAMVGCVFTLFCMKIAVDFFDDREPHSRNNTTTNRRPALQFSGNRSHYGTVDHNDLELGGTREPSLRTVW